MSSAINNEPKHTLPYSEYTTKLDNVINSTKKLLTPSDYKLGEFNRKRSEKEFLVGWASINELKDYRFFEHPFHKASALPRDIEKYWDKYFDDFVKLEDYDECLDKDT